MCEFVSVLRWFSDWRTFEREREREREKLRDVKMVKEKWPSDGSQFGHLAGLAQVTFGRGEKNWGRKEERFYCARGGRVWWFRWWKSALKSLSYSLSHSLSLSLPPTSKMQHPIVPVVPMETQGSLLLLLCAMRCLASLMYTSDADVKVKYFIYKSHLRTWE